MTFNPSGKTDDMSLRLKAHRFRNLKNARSDTKQLAVESRQMEERLKELKLVMSREKEQREAHGGGFWKKGQQGSLGSYATDVLEKPREKVMRSKRVRILKNEPINVSERMKGPGTMAHLAQRPCGVSGKENRGKGPRCGQCEERAAHVSCMECGEDYCAGCFAAFHLRGALRTHRSKPLGASNIRTPRLLPTDGHSAPPPTTDLPIKPSEPIKTESLSEQQHVIHQQNSKKENNGVSLLHGEYNAEESAAAFQQALAEWRTAGKEASPRATGEAQASKGKASSVFSIDSSTSMAGLSQKPLQIMFHSNLSYAEQLLLKHHRRTDVPPMVSSTSDRQHDYYIGDKLANISENSESFEATGVNFQSLFDAVVESDQTRTKASEQRPESSLSVVELSENTAASQLKLQLSSRYDVYLPDDSETASAMTCTSVHHLVRDILCVSLPEKPAPDNERAKALTVLPSGVQISQADAAAEIIEVAKPAKRASTAKSRPGSCAKSRPQTRTESRAKSRTGTRARSDYGSRPSSRQGALSRAALYGAGVLTKAPSTGLHEVTTLTFRGHADKATDLASFFTASKHPPIVKKQSEEKKIKLSNRLYQMAPRSWRPDSSVGDTVSDNQVAYIGGDVEDDFPQRGERVKSSPAGGAGGHFSPRPPPTPPRAGVHSRHYRSPCQRAGSALSPSQSSLSPSPRSPSPTPRSLQLSRSGDEARVTSALSGCQSGRMSQMIVVEGGDPSVREMEELAASRRRQTADDADALDQLGWELSSRRQPVDGSISRDSLLTPELPQTDEYLDLGAERSSVNSLQESDTAVRLSGEDLEDDFDDFADDEDEVRALE